MNDLIREELGDSQSEPEFLSGNRRFVYRDTDQTPNVHGDFEFKTEKLEIASSSDS